MKKQTKRYNIINYKYKRIAVLAVSIFFLIFAIQSFSHLPVAPINRTTSNNSTNTLGNIDKYSKPLTAAYIDCTYYSVSKTVYSGSSQSNFQMSSITNDASGQDTTNFVWSGSSSQNAPVINQYVIYGTPSYTGSSLSSSLSADDSKYAQNEFYGAYSDAYNDIQLSEPTPNPDNQLYQINVQCYFDIYSAKSSTWGLSCNSLEFGYFTPSMGAFTSLK